MELTVRTWNLFHGRTVPEGDRLHLEEMVRRITAGSPDVVCLQEVPVWGLARLGEWSGLAVFGSVAMRALGGSLARRLTDLAPRRLRSALTGQANAILFDRRLSPLERVTCELNPAWFRKTQAERLGLPAPETEEWGRNRRIAQVVRLRAANTTLVLVNAHLTSPADSRAADAELGRVLSFAGTFARPDEPIVLCGDLNLRPKGSLTLAGVGGAGYSPPAAGIDHVLVRGLDVVRGPETWPDTARSHHGRLLSDHRPLEAAIIAQ